MEALTGKGTRRSKYSEKGKGSTLVSATKQSNKWLKRVPKRQGDYPRFCLVAAFDRCDITTDDRPHCLDLSLRCGKLELIPVTPAPSSGSMTRLRRKWDGSTKKTSSPPFSQAQPWIWMRGSGLCVIITSYVPICAGARRVACRARTELCTRSLERCMVR